MYDDEAPSVRILSRTTPVARHGFACADCPEGRSISAGTRYAKTVMLFDGDFVIEKGCIGAGCIMAEVDVDAYRIAAKREVPFGSDDLVF